MELIERYIYAVIKKLPKEQQADIEQELHGLINDMLDRKADGEDLSEADVKEVLLELGHPNKLAQRYRDNKRYIIGPDLYDSYVLILKISLITAFSVLSALFVIQSIINPLNLVDHFVEYIISFFTSLIPMAVGWTTVAFILLERLQPEATKKLSLDSKWDPAKLPSLPSHKGRVKRSDAIIGAVINLVIIVFLTFSHRHLGIWLFEEGQFMRSIAFFNTEANTNLLFWLLLFFSINAVKEIFKLIYETWTRLLFILVAIVNTISIAILLFIKDKLWNVNFMNELVEHGLLNEQAASYNTVLILWEQLTFWIIVLSIVGLIIDSIIAFIKFINNK